MVEGACSRAGARRLPAWALHHTATTVRVLVSEAAASARRDGPDGYRPTLTTTGIAGGRWRPDPVLKDRRGSSLLGIGASCREPGRLVVISMSNQRCSMLGPPVGQNEWVVGMNGAAKGNRSISTSSPWAPRPQASTHARRLADYWRGGFVPGGFRLMGTVTGNGKSLASGGIFLILPAITA